MKEEYLAKYPMSKIKITWLLASIVLIGLYVNGAIRHSVKINTDMTKTDQSAYMRYAREMAESNYTYIGGRNRMPVYPFLQSLNYRPGLSDEEFFARGKMFNIVLSVILLIGLYFLLQKYLPFMATVDLILIVAFTVFIFKAAFFQTELLFYFVNFCCFLLMNHMLHRPKWQLAVLTGVVLGIAHLTKASIMVGLVLYLVVALLQEAYRFWQRKRTPDPGAFYTRKRLFMNLISIACIVVLYLAIIFPYIHTSKKVFGRYFYNVNSTFYIWYDSWVEAIEGTRGHGDRVGWPDMPPEEIPSMRKYLREHTLNQIVERFLDGFEVTIRKAAKAYGYFRYFVIYTLFCISIAIAHYKRTLEIFRKHFQLLLFNLMYFTVYIFLYAWYVPVSFGLRLTLAQFLPLMFALSYVIFRLYSPRLYTRYSDGRIGLNRAFVALLAIVLVHDIYFVVAYNIVKTYGGE
jgi:hypothetical protein